MRLGSVRVSSGFLAGAILTALFARFNEIIHIQAASRIRARHLSGYLAGDIINFEIGDAGNPAFSCQDL